ncbi:MAG TPA: FAD-binding oxidoreductase [Chloroflexia bacterium]|nr:FAD-binding oxidoreductase [Chloroflexia bacterium]
MTLYVGQGLEESKIAEFKTTLRGKLLREADNGYDEARTVWNAMIDRKPDLIVRCQGVADVIKAVNFARENRLLVAVRGGGHSITGASVCDGGMMIDLSLMKGIRVNPVERTARAEAGVVWGELDRETQIFGLATPGGQISHTGIAGLTLGGGIGNLMRNHGLTIDNLISVDVVTASGEYLTASASQNQDLFWAIRGGGGNFGIVTSFEYKLHPVGPIIAGGIAFYPFAYARPLLTFFRDYMTGARDELTCTALMVTMPPAPFVPVEFHNQKMVALQVCYCGNLAEGMDEISKIRSYTRPAIDLLGAVPYTMVQSLSDEATRFGLQNYAKTHLFTSMSDEAIGLLVKHFSEVTSPMTGVTIMALGGAMSRIAGEDTAFAHRVNGFECMINAAWTDRYDAEQHIEWTRNLYSALKPYASGRVYVNHLNADEGGDTVDNAYPKATYQRLAALKAMYDPGNLFRLNHNIKPAQ